jgi:hypothetical protein
MIRRPRVSAVAAGALALVAVSVVPARAQYGRPMVSDPPLGEKYHVEAVLNFWNPSLDAVVSSESLGIPGSDIDVKTDLGYVDKSIREFRFVLRPGRKHKVRVAYTPIKYEGDVLLQRTIIFNGIAFTVGLPIQTEFTWNTWRFGYEHDFIYNDRGFVGFIVEARYTDAQLSLRSPIDDEFTQAKGPVPAIGGIGRVYVQKHVSITGELTGMKLPEIQDYVGSFFDLDIYGTVNFTNNFGVQAGYRTLDAAYTAKRDTGDLELRGLYFTGVVRF